ncbi:MAG: FxsA family protein [Planctomycetaceae bacterium]|nr:FxsA family protein [Planctomycetaceae bacterium]
MKFYWKSTLLFMFVPAIELAGLWFFAYVFGLIYAFVVIIGISVIGVFLAKRQGLSCWIEFNRQVDSGDVPKVPVMNGMLILIAAMLLIVPGLLSDLCGILLLLPFVRTIIIDHLTMRFENYRKKNKNNYDQNDNNKDDVIDIS